MELNEAVSGELKNILPELEKIEIKHNPFGEVPKEQLVKALELLEEFSEEWL